MCTLRIDCLSDFFPNLSVDLKHLRFNLLVEEKTLDKTTNLEPSGFNNGQL